MPLMLASQIQEAVGVVAVGGGMAIAIVAIIFGSIRQVLQTRSREQSRREIAAYVAEGSMSPEQGERLMNAGRSSSACKNG
jgi:hypothetical protein